MLKSDLNKYVYINKIFSIFNYVFDPVKKYLKKTNCIYYQKLID